MNMILTNQNDIYIFFEVIRQIEPKSILDIGMFLKRAGSVSRKAMDGEVAEDIRLDGIDFFREIDFPVWKNIYNRIIDYQVFLAEDEKQTYDLVILLGADALRQIISLKEIARKATELSRYVLTDKFADVWVMQYADAKVIDLKVEEDTYFLIDFGEQ